MAYGHMGDLVIINNPILLIFDSSFSSRSNKISHSCPIKTVEYRK
jgi:hypothetical protein